MDTASRCGCVEWVTQERLNAEMRANATSAEAPSDTQKDQRNGAENIRKKWEQTVAQDLRQWAAPGSRDGELAGSKWMHTFDHGRLTAQVSSLETQLQVHSQDTGTSHARRPSCRRHGDPSEEANGQRFRNTNRLDTGAVERPDSTCDFLNPNDRVGSFSLESLPEEEQSKREVLARQLEERMETLGEALPCWKVTAARVATGLMRASSWANLDKSSLSHAMLLMGGERLVLRVLLVELAEDCYNVLLFDGNAVDDRVKPNASIVIAGLVVHLPTAGGYVTSPRTPPGLRVSSKELGWTHGYWITLWSREVARMAVQVDANEKEMKRLLKAPGKMGDQWGPTDPVDMIRMDPAECSELEEIQGVEVALERRVSWPISGCSKTRIIWLKGRAKIQDSFVGLMILEVPNVTLVAEASLPYDDYVSIQSLHARAWKAILLPALTIWAIAWAGGRPLLRKTLPFGTAVSICLLLRTLGDCMAAPWNRFQASTAIVTVVLLMEPGITLERLILKFLQRLAGTCCGSLLAILMALSIEVMGKDPVQICSFCFAVFTIFGTFQVLRGHLSFMFSAMCISCAAVMFGFMVSGWVLIHAQVVSVLVGEIISLVCSLFFELVLGDPSGGPWSLVHLVKSCKDILDQTHTAVDLVFTKHTSLLLSSTASRSVQFRRSGRARTLSGSLLDLLTRRVSPALSDVVARLGILEEEEAGRAQRARSCVEEIQEKPRDYQLLPQQVHGLFLQACALGHISPLAPRDWETIGRHFQSVRGFMRVALEMLKYILDLALNPLGRAPSAGECSGKLERLCGSLEGAREELLKAWATSKTAGSETAAADDETATASLHATAALCTLHPTGQGFDGLVVEMASFALFYFQWLKVEEKEAELQERLASLLSSSPLCMQ
ncbi:unnamed protein product [Durusdinium trenchii]|uniref:Uncharacterized protein n=2 Tax=Durusdinium trenchii TaxID=1381693 RepID=A0ABP0K9I9_9DINO